MRRIAVTFTVLVAALCLLSAPASSETTRTSGSDRVQALEQGIVTELNAVRTRTRPTPAGRLPRAAERLRRPFAGDARGRLLRALLEGRDAVLGPCAALLSRSTGSAPGRPARTCSTRAVATRRRDGDRQLDELPVAPPEHAVHGLAGGRGRGAPRRVGRWDVRRQADLGDHDGLRARRGGPTSSG